MERRTFEVTELRAGESEDKHKTIEGYAATFDSLSDDLGGFYERIIPGAFANTLNDKADVRALINHNENLILGRTTAGTLELAEDSKGLKVTIYPPSTTYANDLVESMKRGDVSQMSFGFKTDNESWTEEKGKSIREIKAVTLFGVSIAMFPAYADTEVALRSFKTYNNERIEHMRKRIRLAESEL